VDPGQIYAGVPRLASLLRLLGDLPEDAVVDGDVYQGALVEAVRHFQSRHGLEADGRIGKGTLAALNTPLATRVRQLELTLERWRWQPREFTPSIMVNIPEFKLRALDASHRVSMEMNVVVGTARTQTPLLGEDMKYVVMRPYWNVPYSIQRNEILPALAKDPAYLSKHAYEVVTRTRQVVTTGEVTPEQVLELKSGQLYIRQQPGPKNSLGLVKFMFPNQENVYLHDTPSKSLFSRARRDFSHGCVRVADPPALAAWVLQENEGWTPERIGTAMQGEDSQSISLKRPIPVRIVYHTAVVLENGEARFFEDIYGRDSELERQLASLY
jgi:murein L,D-transpeptidase YcbB/YkuD